MLNNAALTLHHKGYDPATRLNAWTRTHYPAVNWHGKQAAAVADKGLVTADEITVRIPTGGPMAAAVGDIAVRGLRDEADPRAAQRAAESFVVTAVRDNRRGSPAMHHWRLEGK